MMTFGDFMKQQGLAFALTISSVSWFAGSAAFAADSDAASVLTAPIIALDVDPVLSTDLLSAYEDQGDTYKPRTHHFLDDGRPKYINRLILEKSPYLLQHAHNPVNWYPFGEAAFELATKENKPVFLSIGYATCHWCHVMERESFESEEIAAQLNENFIAIKVDREQMPDVDSLYMSAVLMINGHGGWPMSNFLDEQGRPFHGATYIPPDSFAALLDRITEVWEADKPAILRSAIQISSALNEINTLSEQVRELGESEVDQALRILVAQHDDEFGGFSGAPKFPQESSLMFLLNEARLKGERSSFNAVNYTLSKMAAGGIHDQIGGGFHRYAVDGEWLVPHFEKMLYNQGLLARIYSQAYTMGGDSDHRSTAMDILDYVEREMMSPEGLFYSATDADSEGAEGTFFLWTESDLTTTLGEDDAAFAKRLWGVTPEGNFEHKSILFRPVGFEQFAKDEGISLEELHIKRRTIATTLRNERENRIHPLRDEKIITAWNGLMINAYAEAGYALNEQRYIDVAFRAGNQLWDAVRVDDAASESNAMWRTLYNGATSVPARQTDYAYLAEAMLTLYDVSGDQLWLDRTTTLANEMIERFWDDKQGGFFLGEASVSGTALAIRPKDLHDSSIPSGNAVALRVLAMLYKRTGEEAFNEQANSLIAAFSSSIVERIGGFFYMLQGTSEHLFGETGPHKYAGRGTVQVTGKRLDEKTAELKFRMKPGWHVNSHEPAQDYLIPTSVTSDIPNGISNVSFPEPVLRKLGFERTELSLFEEVFSIQVTVDEDQIDNATLEVDVRVQACSDEVCLAPETVELAVSWVD